MVIIFIIFKIGEDLNGKTLLTILSSFQLYPLLSASAPMFNRVDDIWPIAGDKFYVVMFGELQKILNKANDEGKPEPKERPLARL